MGMFNTKKIAVALLDDHPIVRQSFELVAEKEPDIYVAGSFGYSEELLAWLAAGNKIDVLVLDYILNTDEIDGLSLIKRLLLRYPDLKILLSSSIESLAVIRSAMLRGVKGFIGKREETEQYFDAIRAIVDGKEYLPLELQSAMSQIPVRKRDQVAMRNADPANANSQNFSELSKLLTPREAEVLNWYLDGMQIIEIAAKLKRSRKTISGHKQAGMKKLGLESDLELFRYRDDLFK